MGENCKLNNDLRTLYQIHTACRLGWNRHGLIRFVSLLMACSWNHSENVSWHPSQRHNLRKKTSFGQRFHHHIYTIGQILDLQSLAERRLWKSAKKRIDALTPYLCHVVCLEMIVFVYMSMHILGYYYSP